MNSKTKRRMIVVIGVIAIVVILLLAVVGGSSSAKVVSVADIASGGYADTKVKVSGAVADNSYSVDNNGVLTFDILDEKDGKTKLHVSYDKGVSATFGNGITAVCTGRVNSDGTLECSELVTQCPSKYESATDALGVAQLLGYGDAMLGKTTKVAGTVQAGSLADATKNVRFVMMDDGGNASLPIVYTGALSDDVKDGAKVVVMGAVDAQGNFLATSVSLEG